VLAYSSLIIYLQIFNKDKALPFSGKPKSIITLQKTSEEGIFFLKYLSLAERPRPSVRDSSEKPAARNEGGLATDSPPRRETPKTV